MAHSLSPAPAATATPISSGYRNKTPVSSSIGFQRVGARNQASVQATDNKLVGRRALTLGLGGALLGLSVSGDRSANAAARRPPPPPPKEKQDPNMSGVQAKVLASKKRKDAMKEAAAKLREKGKPVGQTPE